MTTVSTLGALVALAVAIVLILRKVPPAYGMIAGALAGGLCGGADLVQTVTLMIGGAQGITNAVMRILAAGVLAGVLIESGAAHTIAETIVRKVGETRALLALAVATLILTAVGVFIDVAVITVAPIALSIAQRAGISRAALTEFDGKPFQSVSKADETLDKLADETEEQKAAEKQLEPFIERVKTLLGERVKDVRLTHRLTDTPAIVVTDADEMSTQMAKLFAAAGQQAPEVKYIFELNPEHALVKRASDVGDNEHFAEWIDLLLDQALLAERGTLEDPNLFIRRMNKLLSA